MSDSEEPYNYAMQLVSSVSLPMVLLYAIKLKVLETIAEAGSNAQLSSHEIATRLAISNKHAPAMIDRMLRLLSSHSVVTCTQREFESNLVRAYGLAPVAKHFIPNKNGVSLGPMMELNLNKFSIDNWFKFQDLIFEGDTLFDKVHVNSGFEHMGLDERFNAVFNTAMVDTSAIVIKEILECYRGFENLKSLVDVGGGFGITLNMILSKHPTIKGINLDLPHVVQHAPLYPGVQHVGGDMFDNIPQGDAILMKWVLHGWSDDHCIKLLENCYKAIPDYGKVIVVDAILPILPDTSSCVKSVTQVDTMLMTQTVGGKERTEHEFSALAKAAGFGGMRKKCYVCTHWVMEFYK